jgi:hypothetical protein
VNAVKPAQAWAAGGGYPCRFEHRGCKAILKTKESEQSHASKSCRFRPDGAAAIATARVGAIKRPAKVAGKVVGQSGRASAVHDGPGMVRREQRPAQAAHGGPEKVLRGWRRLVLGGGGGGLEGALHRVGPDCAADVRPFSKFVLFFQKVPANWPCAR